MVKFQIKNCQTILGQQVQVVGSFHSWDTTKAIALQTCQKRYPLWESEDTYIPLQATGYIEYKYIIRSNGNILWEEGPNRRATIQSPANIILTDVAFGKTLLAVETQINPSNVLPELSSPTTVSAFEALRLTSSDSKDSEGSPVQINIVQRFTTGVTQQSSIIKRLVQLDSERRTWKQKLEVVAQIMEEFQSEADFKEKGLALIAVYLNFVASGQIKCAENGTHFRPNHHANIAYDIYLKIDRELQTPFNQFLCRSIKENLPSFSDQFTVTVPLTRIRDIAHRNDIPQVLKSEIKNRLQNKLHRCAEPSDLKTCEEILFNRIRPRSDLSQAFKHEFEIFYEELKEFFNALSLNTLLEKIGNYQPLACFLKVKNEGWDCLEIIRLGTEARQFLIQTMLTYENSKSNKSQYQLATLADINLERYLFVKVSEALQLERADLSKIRSQIIYNLLLSRTAVEELTISTAELALFDQSEHQLRYLASLERVARLAQQFTQLISTSFDDIAVQVGNAFNISKHSVNVFSESLVRQNLIFQLANCLDIQIALVRKQLKHPPFLIISNGQKSTGKPRFVKSIYEVLESNSNTNFVVFVEEADGSEEIPQEVSGVILRHPIPQLSHLAIRARQANIVFVCCNVQTDFDNIRNQALNQEFVKLLVNTDGNIQLQPATKQSYVPAQFAIQDAVFQHEIQTETDTDSQFPDIYEENDQRSIGSKAINALELEKLSQSVKNDWHTPKQYIVSNQLLQSVLTGVKDQYLNLLKQLQVVQQAQVESIRLSIVRLMKLQFEKFDSLMTEVASEVSKALGQSCSLAVRSSSSMEDLPGQAGAGLYDSFIGVKPHIQNIKTAILDVFLSLYTQRAVINRRQIKLTKTSNILVPLMAVLIQHQVKADYSFVIHTKDFLRKEGMQELVSIEVAVGLGETLASGNQKGQPYRVIVDKDDDVKIFSFANYSNAVCSQGVKIVDYSKQQLSKDPLKLVKISQKLTSIARTIVKAYDGVDQDIEGVITDEQVAIVQTRPQI